MRWSEDCVTLTVRGSQRGYRVDTKIAHRIERGGRGDAQSVSEEALASGERWTMICLGSTATPGPRALAGAHDIPKLWEAWSVTRTQNYTQSH